MAEDLTSQGTPQEASSGLEEQPSAASGDAPQTQQSTGEPQPEQSGTPASERQPEQRSSGLPSNWHEDPQFRNFQRQIASTLSEKDKQIRQLREQIDELSVRDMDDDQYAAFQQKKIQEAFAQERQQLDQQRQQLAEQAARLRISKELEVPPDVIADAEDPDTAWALGARHKIGQLQSHIKELEKQIESAKRQEMQNSPGNQPDLGQGSRSRSGVPNDLSKVEWDSNEGMMEFYRKLAEEMEAGS